ncbi:MAG TPA: condensation domain-containing protein, partial [Ktedonobacteraceae bacterium]|nr:condensation domain-containing protein [Ktedonobacteraceae bacterium]
LNSNGKVDRRALPAPRRDREVAGTQYQAPHTEIERVLESLWAGVLRVPQVGINDNFFALGGHSLLVVQLIARVRSVFQIDLPIRALFESPTIAGLARHIQSHKADYSLPSLPEFQPGVRPQHIPLALAQQRFWFLDRLDPGNPAYNVPLALRISGPFQPEYCQETLQILARRHETLRTTLGTVKGKPVQRIVEQPDIPFLPINLSGLDEEGKEQAAIIALEEEVARPFKLTAGPLIRAMHLRLSSSEHMLLITMHHIITDGWSFDLLLQEFCHVYNALAANRSPELPDLPIQYADFAVWQRKWQEQGLMDRQLEYWKRQLAGLPESTLPLDGPQVAQSTAPLAASVVRLSPALRDSVHQLSQREGVTPFMTLLALFQMLLGAWTRRDDLAVGTLVANRAQVEVEALVGCFVNTLVLRTSLAGNPSFRELLRRVQETALGAYVHQDTPFDAIVNALRSPQQRTRRPLYMAMFALHTMPQEIAPALTELELAPIDLRSKTARTDLMLSLSEAKGEISGALEYNADLFAETTIARLARHYMRLVELACEQPESTLQDLLTRAGVITGS